MIRPGFTTATHSSGFPLPLPIRVSAGFFVTGLSGKIRIQILPPRLRLRASATRAASICRLVTQPGSSAFSPYSPNASVAPRCAVPRIRPRWAFRYLTRLGISTRGVPSRFRRRGAQHFALEDPDLDADRPVRRVGRREPVVDVRADRVERHAAVAVPLLARDLAAAQPPRARDPDAVGAQAQRGGDRLLHGAAERDTLLELERHVLRHELGVELGVDDLLDVEVDLLARPRLQLVLQLLHLGPLPADDDARPGRGDRDPRPVRRALDVDLGDARVIELILDVAPDLHILVQQICVALRREPAGAPRPRRTEAEADRMRLLAHLYVFSLDLEPLDVDPFDLAPFGFAALFGAALGVGRAAARPFLAAGGRGALGLVAHPDREVAGPVPDGEGAPHRARLHALHRGAAIGHRIDHAEIVEVAYLVVVLGVGDRRTEDLLDDPGRGTRRVLERRQRFADRLPANLIQHEPRLPGGHADETGSRERSHGATPSPSARSRPSRPRRAP